MATVLLLALYYILPVRTNDSNVDSEDDTTTPTGSIEVSTPPSQTTDLNGITEQKPLEEEEIENPAEAWAKLSANPDLLTDDNWDQISNIVEAWVIEEGITIIDTVTARIEDEELKETVIRYGLRTEVEGNPKAAFDYALQFESEGGGIFDISENPYMNYVLYQWVRVQPVHALNRVLDIDSNSQKSRLVDDIFGSWVRNDIKGMVDSIPQLPSEVQDTVRIHGIAHLSRESIDEALSLFDDIENEAKKGQAARNIALSWAEEDPEAALNWAQTNQNTESIRSQVTSTILTSLASKSPQKAFDVALELPLNEDGVGLEASVLATMAYTNVERALELLPRVRAGETQQTAYMGVGSGLAMQGKTTEAIELGKDLPEEDQLNYYTTVGTMALTGSLISGVTGQELEKDVFETIDRIPLAAARSKIAVQAIIMDQLSNSYSDEEIESLKEYVSEEDMEDLEKGLEQLESMPSILF